MPNNGDKELVPLNGKHLPYGFPDSVVKQALIYCRESESVALGWRRLTALLESGGMKHIPGYQRVWEWVKEDKECYDAVLSPNKRKMVAISEDVAEIAAERFIQALPNLSDSQAAVPYGIAMQKRTEWERVGQPGTVIPIQLNVSAGGQAAANPWSKDKD